MADKEQIIKEKVEHSGIFDFPSLYSFCHTWFKEDNYGVDEDKYSEKTDGTKRDLDIEWKAYKKFTDYFKFEHKIRFEVRGMSDVEVEIDGKKKTMNKGKVSVEITGSLVMDHESKWDTSPFSRFMRDVYNRYVIPSRVSEGKDKVNEDAQDFKEEVKAFLDLSAKR